jgi:hypothetical protein
MNRPPSATRYTSTANRRPLLIEIALIAFVIAAIFVAALVGMSAALAADAAEQRAVFAFEQYPDADVNYVFAGTNA